jgi:uncharacterized protein YkwD
VLVVILSLTTAQVLNVQRVRAQSASENAQFLSAHNAERKTLGLVPLVWDAKLTAYASAYAATQDKAGAGCAGVLKHSGGPYGENLYWYWTTTRVKATPAQALADWISEKKYYNYQTNSCASGHDCGHYTQVVWARTLRVGCVARKCTSNALATYIICNYDPPGNYVGQRPY